MDIWGVTNKAVMNIRVQTFVRTCTFISFGYWPRSGTDESDFRDMFDFLKTAELSSKVISPFYTPMAVLPHTCQQLSTSATVTGVQDELTVVLIGVFLMTTDAEHLSCVLFAIHTSFLVKCSLFYWVIFSPLSFESSFSSLNTNPLSNVQLTNVFLPVLWLRLTFSTAPVKEQV